ncbi:MAG: hypothetical protein E7I21_10655 [Limosilactobacillus fermentum]|nr:hypothetical protein [Limosilactobacillus fermentum]
MLTALRTDKINLSRTKTALHRTRLRFLERLNFSVFFFYKPNRQTAPVLAALRKTRTEKYERNFSVFQFLLISGGSKGDINHMKNNNIFSFGYEGRSKAMSHVNKRKTRKVR